MPASWPVIRFGADPTACPRLDVHAVYLGTPGPDPICPPGIVGRSVAVMIQPDLSAGLPSGSEPRPLHAGRSLAVTRTTSAVNRTMTEVLAQPGVRVTISYRAGQSLARTIQASVRTLAGARRAMRRAVSGPARIAGPELVTRTGRTARPAVPPQGPYAGGGFDACAAPSAAAMTSWLASSYRAVGVYIGGVNRGCAQANLTPGWLASIVSQGWHYFPIYPGLQSSCVLASGDARITTSQAAAEGTAAADDAVNKAISLGIPAKTPLSFDMEAYGPACNGQVLAFLSAWDGELHQRGYLAGVYESFTNILALAGAAGSITEPDIIYYADWDGAATTSSSYMPAMWTSHARIHQYRGGHYETHGGVTLDVDSDQLDLAAGAVLPPGDRTGFRPSVAINANGTAEWFAKSAGGALTHSWQHPVGTLTWSAMHTVGASPTSVTTNPAVIAEQDGALSVFAGNSAGQIVHAWQQAGFPNGWQWGKPLPALAGAALPGTDPTALLLPRGDVAVYQTVVGGAVLVTAQRGPNDNSGWIPWGDIGGTCASSPVPLVDGAGKVDVFCVTSAGSAAVIHWDGSSWGGWTILPGSPANLTGVPAVVVNGTGQTELFAATTAGGLDYAWQGGTGGGWTWGAALAGPGGAVKVTGSPSAAVWPAGQVVVYVKLAGGQLGVARQTGAAGTASWGSWSTVGGVAGGIMGSPAGWLNSSGAAAAAALDGNRHLVVTSNAGAGWSDWQIVGTGF